MASLEKWNDKIKNNILKLSWDDYIKKIISWQVMNLYKNSGMISRFPESSRIKNIMNINNYYNRDIKGIDYDFGKNFFENFKILLDQNYVPNLFNFPPLENSDFVDESGECNNSYLSYNLIDNVENVLYSYSIKSNCKNILNSIMILDNSENIYMCTGIIKGFNIFYSKYINNSSNIWFSTNLIGCNDCILCDGLNNKSFCIKNKQYEKEEYFKQKNNILSNKDYLNIFKNYVVNKRGNNIASKNVNGNFILNSENITNGLFVYQVKDSKNILFAGSNDITEKTSNSINISFCKDLHASVGAGKGDNIYFCISTGFGTNLYYDWFTIASSFCLGCIGLKNKQFCILNKQYSKEEWYELVDKIFAQMNSDGILGEFFPAKFNPFYFNDTMAYLINDTFTKEEVEKDGYMWRDGNINVDIPKGVEIINGLDLNNFQGYDSDGKWYINSDILKKVIVAPNGNYYKIVKMEYDFLVNNGLPIPENHWLDRIKMGFEFK